MSVDQTDCIDIISTNVETGTVILTVSDHLEWDDSISHLGILQKKLNSYLAFVESGEIFAEYPNARGRSVVFRVVFKHAPDQVGISFLIRAQRVIEGAGFTFRHELFAAPCDE